MLGTRWPHEGEASVALFDAQGRRVKSVFTGVARGAEERVLSVQGLAPGIYVVVARQGDASATERVVVLP